MSRIEKEHHNNNKPIKGSLTIVGTGIQAVRDITLETRQSIKYSEKVLYLVGDTITGIWVKKLRPDAQSLTDYYVEGRRRS
ncbi:MAG: hypothetical protein M3530_11615, partial [Thermoproteota archaeon]|nr:hypothetical protein [Thermoproteota archaeon]